MNQAWYSELPEARDEEIRAALDRACARVQRNLPQFTTQYQSACSTDLQYKPIANTDWTNGFWTGEIWLAYEHTQNEQFKNAALIQAEILNGASRREFRLIITISVFSILCRVLPAGS